MYTYCLFFAAFMFTVCAVASFAYRSVPALTEAVSGSNQDASKFVKQYDLGIGGGCTVAVVLTTVPLRLAHTMTKKLAKIQEQRANPWQLRTVLRVAQLITICTAIVQISYAGASLGQLFALPFSTSVFAVYGGVYGGITVLLTASAGMWVSSTAHKDIVWCYYARVLPFLTAVLVAASGIALGGIPEALNAVDKQFAAQPEATVDSVRVTVESQLLVTGVLCCFACIFQLVSMFSSRSLYWHLVQEEIEGDGWVGGGDGNRLTMQRLRERDALLEGLSLFFSFLCVPLHSSPLPPLPPSPPSLFKKGSRPTVSPSKTSWASSTSR